jgi:RNA polymerase sigma-70 factor (ECF subfamily)
MDEDELVIRAQQGDRHAFAQLAVGHHGRLFRVAHAILRDHDAADDATQQAFIEIWRCLPRLRDAARFPAWSYRLLVRACLAEARRGPRIVRFATIEEVASASVADAVADVVQRDQLERAFRRLSPEHRAVIVLRHLAGLTPDEVAEVLGVPRRTVYSRLRRAVLAMRAEMEADLRPSQPLAPRQEVSR